MPVAFSRRTPSPPESRLSGRIRRYRLRVHAHHDHGAPRSTRALAVVLALTLAYTVAEVAGGLWTDSLALLADAGHMLSDSSSLAIALFAAWLALRPATPERSFGFHRAEILAALFNGVALVAISIWIFVEAFRRLSDPPDVLGGWMLAIAAGGVVVNVLAASLLARADRENLNIRAAFRHVLADLLGSLGVVAAALVILATEWYYADPLISIAVALLVLASSWSVLSDSVSVLLEAAPRGVDPRAVERAIVDSPGVASVHDLHIWTITSGFPALSAHVLVARGDDCHGRRRELEALLEREFGITHTTLQVDHAADGLLQVSGDAVRRA
jgi:cobalt-zinc-cadmium efflux system protein